jgi:hypothetical protein
MQFRKVWRRSWLQVAACGLSLLAGWAVIGAPYMAITGKFTIKNTAIQIVQPQAESVAPMPPDVKEPTVKIELPRESWVGRAWKSRWIWGARKFGEELLKGFFYVTWIPALLAVWWFRHRLGRTPGHWAVALVCLAMMLVLYRVATFMHYLSDRHTLLLILCGSFWSAAGFLAIGRKLAGFACKWLETLSIPANAGLAIPWRLAQEPRFWSGLLLVSLTAATLYKNLEPLHANRRGFRDAGQWITEHTDSSDEVLDPYCWTHYYAGRVFQEGKPLIVPPGHERVCYVVVEESGNEHPRLPTVGQAKQMAQTGLKVFECKARRKKEICDVCVYAVPIKP